MTGPCLKFHCEGISEFIVVYFTPFSLSNVVALCVFRKHYGTTGRTVYMGASIRDVLSIEKFKLPGTAHKEKRVELLRTFQLTKADSITQILLLRTCFENSKNIVKRIITCIIFFYLS